MSAPPAVVAYVGLGANLGEDLPATLREALDRLDATGGVHVEAVSPAYRTAPIGPVPQGDYLNAVARLSTTLPPHDLLAVLLGIEAELGRVRTVRFGPRTCDLDLLLYADRTLDDPDLTVPHPRLAERRFVLEPLAALDPGLRLPDGRAVRALLDAVGGQAVEPVPALRLR